MTDKTIKYYKYCWILTVLVESAVLLLQSAVLLLQAAVLLLQFIR